MKKINSINVNKIWGYEKWLYSPLKENPTYIEGTKEIVPHGPLIKIIKADQPLSIQVHPDDELAKELEGMDNGKAESWMVLESNDAEAIVGLNNYDEEYIRKSFSDKNFKDNLKTISAKVGMFIDVPAGLVHGIGANLKVLEVQQPSDVTYRYYDYDRLQDGKPRELHVDKALRSQKDLPWELSPTTNGDNKIFKTEFYTQEYGQGKKIVDADSIVIDITNEVAYMVNKDEEINFEKYCIVREN